MAWSSGSVVAARRNADVTRITLHSPGAGGRAHSREDEEDDEDDYDSGHGHGHGYGHGIESQQGAERAALTRTVRADLRTSTHAANYPPAMSPPAMSRGASLLRIAIAYLLAIAAGLAWLVWGPDTAYLWLDGLIADVVATLVVFGFSRTYGNSSFYDAYWSVIPPLLAFYWWIAAGTPADDARWWLLMVVLLAWSIRLTANWVRTFPGMHHEDWRYAMVRGRAGRFEAVADLLGIHVFPTLQVFAGLVPVYVVATRSGEPLGWLDIVAFAVGLAALALETIADVQMHRFLATRDPGQVLDTGVWSWSRHPNYVGECGIWLSMGLFGLAAWPGAWWVLIGIAAMLAMFLGVSIPMMEQRSLGRRPEYREAMDRVSKFLPRPPKKRAHQAPRT